MKAYGDIESVSFSAGEQRRRVSGDGESRLVPAPSRGAIDVARLGPSREIVFGPRDDQPTVEQITNYANSILKGIKMHYRNGREAKNGDKVVQFSIEGGNVTHLGVLHSATPGNDYCNGVIAPIQDARSGACMCDCLHVDDLAELLKEKGLDKRPAGK